MSEGARPKPSLLKEAGMQIASGGSAGLVEVCAMHPLDLVKTRLQLQREPPKGGSAAGGHYYKGIVDCMRTMYRVEGLSSFWKGILPPIFVETPKRAVKFCTFEQYKKFFMDLCNSPKPTPLSLALAGMCAGITEAFLINPFEVVKVTLQSNRAQEKDAPSTWSVTKEIIKKEGFGIRGLNKGLLATIIRNAIHNMCFLGFYHTMKLFIPEYEDPWKEFCRKSTLGFLAGTLGASLNIPFDVTKSRIQGPQPQPGVIKYRTTFGSMASVYREEGWRALYKGWLPKVLRFGPGGAILMVVYDYTYNYLCTRFPD